MTTERYSSLLIALAKWTPEGEDFGGSVAAPFSAELVRALPVDRVSVWLYTNASADSLECIALCDARGPSARLEPLQAQTFPRYFRELQAARALGADDAQADPRTSELSDSYLLPLGIQSLLDAPLFAGGHLAGIVCCESRSPRIWSHEERELVASVADLLGRMLAEHRQEKIRRQAARDAARREELYRRVVEEQDDIILRSRPGGEVLFANAAAYRFVHGPGVQQAAENLMNYVPSEDRSIIRAAVLTLSPSSPSVVYEHRIRRHDGALILHSFHTRAFFDEQGAIEGYQAIGRNVELERQKQQTLREAERLEALAVLSSGIAHDFNNLLTPIMVFAELLLGEAKDEETSDGLRQILQASDRARDLVRQILNFARKDTSRSPIATSLALREAIAFVRAALPANIQLITEVDDNCGVVLAQPTDLYQIISNLCTNAIQAMPTGGLLHVTAGLVQDRLQLQVRDTGVGMTEEVRRRIFEPFFTTKAAGDGTGLGLAMVHGTVRSLDGVIDVQSAPGRGTTFVIQLPTQGREKGPASSAPGTVPLATRPALLVDDDPAVLTSVRATLEGLGFPVTSRSSAAEALIEWQRVPGHYGLLITDLTMPQASGADLLFRIRQLDPRAPLVLMSGFGEVLSQATGTFPPGVSILPKPFSRKELGRALEEALTWGTSVTP